MAESIEESLPSMRQFESALDSQESKQFVELKSKLNIADLKSRSDMSSVFEDETVIIGKIKHDSIRRTPTDSFEFCRDSMQSVFTSVGRSELQTITQQLTEESQDLKQPSEEVILVDHQLTNINQIA